MDASMSYMSAPQGTQGDMNLSTTVGASTASSGMVTMKQREHTTFRSNNVRFLQEQNKEATRALDAMEEERDEAVQAVFKWEQQREKVQREYAAMQQQMAATEEKVNAAAAEVHKRDEQIRVLTEQNRSLLEMLEHEEKESKEKQHNLDEVTHDSHRLQKISDQYDKVKDTGNQQLTGAYTEIAKYEEEMRNATMETEQLREAEMNFQAQAKIDVETLEEKLKESKDKNVQKLQQIQHNEVHEHRLAEGIQRLKETLEELMAQQKGVKMQLDMESDSAEKWSHSKAEVEHRKVSLQRNVEALREALKASEEQNAAMQDESKQGADNFRQLGDKVYALMDQLRQHQMDLKKQEQNGVEKQKKITQFDKRSAELQQTLQFEVDAKLAAESEARGAAQMQALLLKKNKMLEEAHQLALKAQEKVEKRLSELTEKAHALQTQNDYLGTRIDGNEEDKGALRYELRRAEDEMRQANTYNQQLNQQQQEANDRQSIAETERAALRAELDYIKREDMLDESGRTKPILIESESKLIERLQINEFLFSAQQARNPVPMLVEKVSHVLEMLHTSQAQADLYLQDLQRSNSMLTALRQKNMTLYEKVQMCETWKMRALLKIASNEFEVRQAVKGVKRDAEPNHKLYLDGLQYTNKELEELKKVIMNYGKQDLTKEIHLQDNALDESSTGLLIDLLDMCPYLGRLNLKRNKLSDAAINKLQTYIERIPGVTSVPRDPATGALKAKSGNQIRLTVDLEDQNPPDPNESREAAEAALPTDDLYSQDAEAFLKTGAGVTAQSRLQGPEVPGSSQRTLLPNQRGAAAGPGGGTSLPRIGR
jgi:hypothetical protein